MATRSSILAWRIPWTDEPGWLQSRGLQRVGHDWVTEHIGNPSTACCVFPDSLLTVAPNVRYLHEECPNLAIVSTEYTLFSFLKTAKEKWNSVCVCVCVCVYSEKQEYFMRNGIIHKDSDKWLVLYNICIPHPPPPKQKSKVIHIREDCKFRTGRNTSKFLKLTLSFHIFLVLFFPPSPILVSLFPLKSHCFLNNFIWKRAGLLKRNGITIPCNAFSTQHKLSMRWATKQVSSRTHCRAPGTLLNTLY